MSDAARARLAHRQTDLLSALVAGAPAPDGFDAARLDVQAGALRAKRADVVAKVAPELPEILGTARFRSEFTEYAAGHPMNANYRADALDFAAHLLAERALEIGVRRALRQWYRERSGPVPLPRSPLARLVHLARYR